MRIAWLGAGAALSFLIVGAGCSAGKQGDGTTGASTQAIQNGTTDTTHTFAVGVCAGSRGSCSAVCSGALITPNLVVTARHCIDHIQYNNPAGTDQHLDCATKPTFTTRMSDTFNITTSSNLWQSSDGWHSVNKIVLPTDDHVCGHDLALLILSDLVPGSEAKPVIPGVQYPMNDKRYIKLFSAIGYGNTSPSSSDLGTRRIHQGISITCIPGDQFFDCPPEIDPAEFVGGDYVCGGDSGSSAYEQYTLEHSTPVSLGILSRGGEDLKTNTCVGSIYTRLDKWRDLVVNTANEASNNWSLYPKPNPDWTVYVPPPAPDAGAPDASTKPEAGTLKLGEACTASSQCASGVCADTGDGTQLCSRDCNPDDATSCPDGYACTQNLCLPGAPAIPAPAAVTTTTTTSGCSASSASSGPGSWGSLAVAGVAAVAVAFGSRRRRRA